MEYAILQLRTQYEILKANKGIEKSVLSNCLVFEAAMTSTLKYSTKKSKQIECYCGKIVMLKFKIGTHQKEIFK